MGYAAMKKLDGFLAMGGEVPNIDPSEIKIVGLDLPDSANYWFAYCSRVKDIPEEEIAAYAEAIVAANKVDHVVKVYRSGDTLIALDGRTTTRAARLARQIQARRKVPLDERIAVRVVIQHGDQDELYRINLDSHKHRPLTRGQHAKSVLAYFQRVKEDLQKTAAFFRCSVPTVKLLLSHFQLTESLQRKVDTGDLPATIAAKIATLPLDEQDKRYEEMKAAGALRGAAGKNAAEKKRGEKVDKADKTRVRPKQFLMKWYGELKKDNYQAMAEMLLFVLGGPLPDRLKGDKKFVDTLERAGFNTGREPQGEQGETGAAA